jgi:peptidoglycan/LPS O-acetylase OafA/YrhL
LKISQSNRMGHIDSIRGIAALLVAFRHFSEGYITMPAVKAHGTFLYDIAYQLEFGHLGVIAFFAISGFVICPTLKGGKYDGARKFLISRFFRLFPAFWMSIVLILSTRYLWFGSIPDLPQVLGNIPMLYSFFHVEPIQGLYWTLEVELIFYFLCLSLFLSGWLHKPDSLFFVGLVLIAVSQWIFSRGDIVREIEHTLGGAWINLPWNLAIMFWGGLFRIWYDKRQQTCSLGSYQIPIVVLVVVLLSAILWRPVVVTSTWVVQGKFDKIHEMLPYFFGLGLFIVGALYIKLNNRFLVWLGTISYSLYLLHPIAYGFVRMLIKTHFPDLKDLHLSVYLLVSILAAILLAGLVYHLIEKPAIKIGRYLQNR